MVANSQSVFSIRGSGARDGKSARMKDRWYDGQVWDRYANAISPLGGRWREEGREGGKLKKEQFFPITDKEKLLWRRRKKLCLLRYLLSPFLLSSRRRDGDGERERDG